MCCSRTVEKFGRNACDNMTIIIIVFDIVSRNRPPKLIWQKVVNYARLENADFVKVGMGGYTEDALMENDLKNVYGTLNHCKISDRANQILKQFLALYLVRRSTF